MLYARDFPCGHEMTVGRREGRAPSRWEQDWLILKVSAALAVPSDDDLADILEQQPLEWEEVGRWARRALSRCDANRRLVLATLDLVHTTDGEERRRRFNRICYQLLRIDLPEGSRIAHPDRGLSDAEAEGLLQESLERLDAWKATIRARVPPGLRGS